MITSFPEYRVMLISRDIRECGVSYGRVDVIGHCGKIRVFYKCKKRSDQVEQFMLLWQ